jgi:prepilin-type N-terminal cleavage/methylation domain-containing protein
MPTTDIRNARRAFTLIELLTVMAIIGILAAIIIPTVSSVRVSANKAKTKVQFNQWASAIESFRSEYGYYPSFRGRRQDPKA